MRKPLFKKFLSDPKFEVIQKLEIETPTVFSDALGPEQKIC
jgi:hypothetical protein